jgi:hypothetical protein
MKWLKQQRRKLGNAYRRVRSFVRERLTRRLGGIPGIRREDIDNLRQAGIRDLDELEARFDQGTLADLSTATGLTQKRVAELLDGDFQGTGRRIRSRSRRHAFDFAVTLVVAGFIVLSVPSLRKQVYRPAPTPKQPKVTAVRDVPVYRTIDADDLKVEDEPNAKKWPGLLAPFIGKMATTGISKGATITENQVTKAPFNLGGRLVLKVPLKSVPALDGWPLPQTVNVILSPRNNPDAGAAITAALLALDPSTTPAVASIAVNAADLPQVSRWIGSSDAYLVLRVP